LKKGSSVVLILLLCSVWGAFLNAPTVNAEPKTIIVPDDYSTIQSAINAANEGDSIFVKKGIYNEETLEISKPISLLGEDAKETELHFVTPLVDKQILGAIIKVRSTALSINADEVTISDFTLNTKEYVPFYDMDAMSANGDEIKIVDNIMGKDFNLNLKGDQFSVIDNLMGSGLQVYGSNHVISGNSLNGLASHSSYSCIIENTGNESLHLYGSYNQVLRNSFSTIYLEYADLNTINENNLTSLLIGQWGHNCSHNTICYNRLTGSGPWGILMDAGSFNVFHNNLISGYSGESDGYGVAIEDNSYVVENNIFYHNTFVNNNKNVGCNWQINGIGNSWDNGIEGNYWDDYNGTDANGDGIGDTPYIIDENNQDNFPLMEPAIIPEFPSWTPPLIALIALVAVAGIYRQKLQNRGRNK
jgi:hypothetical protein